MIRIYRYGEVPNSQILARRDTAFQVPDAVLSPIFPCRMPSTVHSRKSQSYEASQSHDAFQWNVTEGATSYDWRLLEGSTEVKTGSSSARNAVISGLTPGTTYKFTGTANKETIYPISDTNDLNWTLEPSGPGFLLVYNYKLEWKERMYVRPIPQSAINLNKNLGQNYGW